MMQPIVSIIIPVYNAEKYLCDCLDSIVNQTLQDIEIICVDDKSTDNSLSVLEKWAEKDSRIRIIAQRENTRQGGARNVGMDCARGKYLWFIDADDYIDIDAVSYLVDKMESLKDVDLLSFNGDSFIVRDNTKIKTDIGCVNRTWPKERKLYLPKDRDLIPSKIEGTCWSYFSKRAFIDQFRFRPSIFYEDACFTFSALTSPGVFYEINYTPYHRRIWENSSTSQNVGQSEKCLKDRIIALQDISTVINDRELQPDHFGVRWFKNWAKYSIKQYWSRSLHDSQTDARIKQLQMEWKLFDATSPLELYKTFKHEPLIVSLTSYPARINSVYSVIKAMKNQTVKADKIILWLAEEQFPAGLESLPGELLSAMDDQFEIKWCHNLKPHKKYYYAMLENPESIIITVDDDIIYPNDIVETLLRSFLRFPYAVSARRAHLITFDQEGRIAPYNKWLWQNKTAGVPSYCLFATGVGGVLYPPHCMHSELFNMEAIEALCLNADDLWLKIMQILNGTPVVIAGKPFSLRRIEGSQENALSKSNVDDSKNDEQLAQLLKKYDNYLGEKDTITQRILLSSLAFADETPRIAAQHDRRELEAIRASRSYRIGRTITFVPRKVRGGVQCVKDHGAGYTFRRTLYHMGLWKDEELENAINETGCKRTAGKYILGLPNVCRSIAKKALMLHPGDIRAAKERYRKAKKRIAVCAFEDFHFAVIENEIRICNLEQNYIIAYVSQRAKKEVSKMLGNKSSLIEWHSYDEPNLPLLQSFNSAEEDLRRQFVQHVKSRQNLDYTIIPSAEYHPDWYLPLIEGTRHYELIVGAHNINSIFFSDQAPEKKRRLFEKADSYCVLSSDLKETMLSGGITQKKIYVFDQYYDSAEHTINPVLTDRLSFVITGGVEDKRKDYQSVVDALRMVPDIHPKIRLILLGKATTQYAREIVSQLDKMKETGLNAVTYSNYVPEESFSEIMTGTDYLLGPVVVETTFHGVPETYGTTKLSGMLPDMIKYAKPAILINDLKIPSNMESSVIRYSSVEELAKAFRMLTDKRIAEEYAEKARANSKQYALENMLWDRQ